MDTLVETANATAVANSTVASLILETTTLLNNLTTAIHNEFVQNSTTESTIIPTDPTMSEDRTSGILGLSFSSSLYSALLEFFVPGREYSELFGR